MLEYPFRSFPHESPSHRLTLNERLKSHSLAETLYPCRCSAELQGVALDLWVACGLRLRVEPTIAYTDRSWCQPMLHPDRKLACSLLGFLSFSCGRQSASWLDPISPTELVCSAFPGFLIENPRLCSTFKTLNSLTFIPTSESSSCSFLLCAVRVLGHRRERCFSNQVFIE